MSTYFFYKFSVEVEDGSGCLIQPATNEYSYVLTAKHVIEGKCKENIRVVRRLWDKQWRETNLKIIDIYFHPDEDKDAAILKVELVEDLDKLFLLSTKEIVENTRGYFLTGHPHGRRDKVSSYRQNKVEIMNPADNVHIEAEIIRQRPSFDQVNGQSGGGILKYFKKKYFLAGIQTQMATEDKYEALGRIEIIPVWVFEEILGNHPKELTEFTKLPNEESVLYIKEGSLEDLIINDLDRRDSISKLEGFLDDFSQSPYISIIWGDEAQCPSFLRQRFVKNEMPRILQNSNFSDVTWFSKGIESLKLLIDWKSFPQGNCSSIIFDALEKSTRSTSQDKLITHLKSKKIPLVIEVDLSIQNKNLSYFSAQYPVPNLEEFLAFWGREWKSLIIDRPLIILIFLSHNLGENQKLGLWKSIKCLRLTSKRKKLEQNIAKIKAQFENLSNPYRFLVLPELNNIIKIHIEEFMENHELKKTFRHPIWTIQKLIKDLKIENEIGVTFLRFFDALILEFYEENKRLRG